MKLLSWMRNIISNGLNPSKEFKGVCLRAQVLEVQDIRTNSFSFSVPSHDLKPPKVEEELWFDEDGFCGFLAIGALGTDPETPKFSAMVSDEEVTEDKKEMGKLITEKLNKFLEEHPDDTSYTKVKGDKESNLCPLQGYDYFYRSSIELTKISNNREVKKKKGLLTNLFNRRHTEQKESCMEKHGTKDVIKRIFEKLHGTSSQTINDDDDSMPKKKDIRKSVQNFRSKVHPVLHSPARDDNKIDGRKKPVLKVPVVTGAFLGSSSILESNRKRENWIKTDSECKSRCYTEHYLVFISLSQELSFHIVCFPFVVLVLEL